MQPNIGIVKNFLQYNLRELKALANVSLFREVAYFLVDLMGLFDDIGNSVS